MTENALTIRPADLADLAGLDRLAALDSASPPTGDVLVAEVGGELWAASRSRPARRSQTPSAPAATWSSCCGTRAASGVRAAPARLLPRAASRAGETGGWGASPRLAQGSLRDGGPSGPPFAFQASPPQELR